MSREPISESVKRKMYAESMGRCMNPNCQKELFSEKGDIIEKAHIVPYSKTVDNSFENLVILCPNCHTEYDKNSAFSPEEVKSWKRIRAYDLKRFFHKKYDTFDELKNEAVPLLLENREYFINTFLKSNKKLWDRVEVLILINNRKISELFEANLSLFQTHREKTYSNLEIVHRFLFHVKEFELTRLDEEKTRSVLFPEEINSIFGISPVHDFLMPMTESLERLIGVFEEKKQYVGIEIGIDSPYLIINESGKMSRIYLDDTPRLRQLYHDYGCFLKSGVRLESLNFALKYIRSKNIPFEFIRNDNLREIRIKGIKLIFIYEYCLSKATLFHMSPEEDSVVINLHNWNGSSCISHEAYEAAKDLNVSLMTMENFYGYIKQFQ